MPRTLPLLAALMAATPAVAAPVPLGRFEGWGVFRDGGRCYAIAEPTRRSRVPDAYMTITTEPAAGRFREVHVRLPSATDSARILIDDRSFSLRVQAPDAWPRDLRDGPRIAARLRAAATIRVEIRTANGRHHTDTYAAAGAPSAIDAADIACMARR